MSEPIVDEILNRKKIEAAAAAERDRQGEAISAAFDRAKAPLEKLRAYHKRLGYSDERAKHLRQFRISLLGMGDWQQPIDIILAGDEPAAVRAFNKHNGIGATDHTHRVTEERLDNDHAALIVELVQRTHEYAALMSSDGREQVAQRVRQAANDDVGRFGESIYCAAADGSADEVASLIADAREASIDFGRKVIDWANWRLGELILNIQESETVQAEHRPDATNERTAEGDLPSASGSGTAKGPGGFDAVITAATALRSFVETHSGLPEGLQVGRQVESDLKRLDTELFLACSCVDLRFPNFDARRGDHTEFFGFSRLPVVYLFSSGPSDNRPPSANFNEAMRRFTKQVTEAAKAAGDNRYPWLCPSPGWYQAIDQLIALAQNRISESRAAAEASRPNGNGPASPTRNDDAVCPRCSRPRTQSEIRDQRVCVACLAEHSKATAQFISPDETLFGVKSAFDRNESPDGAKWRIVKHLGRELYGSLDNTAIFDRIVCDLQFRHGPEAKVLAMPLDAVFAELSQQMPTDQIVRPKEIASATVGTPSESSKPPARPATVNQRMLDILERQPDAIGWTIEQWMEKLTVKSKSTIHKTAAWQKLILAGRALQTADRISRGKANEKD